MRVGIYARVSTVDKSQNPETQLIPLREYCGNMGYRIMEFVDYATGTSDKKRPAYRRLLEAIDRREIDMVLVWSVDRLGRDMRGLLDAWDLMEKRGVHFRSFSQPIDTTLVHGKMIFQIFGVISEFYVAGQKEAIKAGLQRARLKGKPIGRPQMAEKRRRKVQLARELYPHASLRELAKMTGVPKSTVHKIINAQ